MKNGWCPFGVNNVDICSMRTLQRFCSCKGSRNSWVGDRSPKRPTLMKASFQRAGLFVFVELRSPVKPGMTCGTDMTVLLTDAEISKNIP